MSCKIAFEQLPFGLTEHAGEAEVEAAISRSHKRLEDFAALLSPIAALPEYLERMAQLAHHLTLKHFGRVIRLFAPLYLSNECVNSCRYCGFARHHSIQRVTLRLDEVLAEARYLHHEGFRHLLLVAGESPQVISRRYLQECVHRLHPDWCSISLEVGPMATSQYEPIVRAGAEGLVIYQETYHRQVYQFMHPQGPKQDYDWRLETPERAYEAGFKRLGVGVLLGLAPWRADALALAYHVGYLLRYCWKAQITVSIPRLRPAEGGFTPPIQVTERDLVQLVCALRLTYPEVGIVLSTRERPQLRDGLVKLGVTMMSAGSHTEPGGYTGQGRSTITPEGEHATEQFAVADLRSSGEVASVLSRMGYEPVWKDWDKVLNE